MAGEQISIIESSGGGGHKTPGGTGFISLNNKEKLDGGITLGEGAGINREIFPL